MSPYAAASVETTSIGPPSFAAPSSVALANPGIVLDLIAQAETRMRALELWRDRIHSDACLLLDRIKQERLDRAMEIKGLQREVMMLRERSAEAERVARLAQIDRDDALRRCAIANTTAVSAQDRMQAAERRADSAEQWLEQIQTMMVAD